MAFTTMHFAIGMGATALAAIPLCMTIKRGWRGIPFAMTLGGTFACIPDFPRMFREDLPNIPLLSTILGSRKLEKYLMDFGDFFFFHRQLDNQPNEYALHGLFFIILLYNASILYLLKLGKRSKIYDANNNWKNNTSPKNKQHNNNPTHQQKNITEEKIYDKQNDKVYKRQRIKVPYREKRITFDKSKQNIRKSG